MILFSLVKESLSALWANRLRSTLTILGMVMGITSVITVVSTVEGMQANLEDTFDTMGPRTFMVTRFGFGMTMAEYLERMRRKKLTRDLIPAIEEGCPDCEYVGAEGYTSAHLKYGKTRMRWVEVSGQTPNILEMRDLDVARGRYFSWEDDRRRRPVAYIGSRVAEKLFGGEDPVGKKIRVDQHEFTVIGVAKKLGGMFGDEMDTFISIPLSTLQKLYRQPGNPVNLIVSTRNLTQINAAMDQVRVVLRTMRRIPYEQDDDFTMVTPDAVLSFINNITRAFRVLMVSLPLLSIVIGGIVIMNIMMISVTERTREIGIRKSIGATKRAVLAQFLCESLVLSIVGGIFGVTAGIVLGGMVLTRLLDIYTTPTTLAVILGFGISTVVGLFFGVYPALKAAKLDPIKALSYEQ
ncbi:MAG: ABC transporter permease [bacterium]|nr:ABC transporter permease [bacterium]